MNLIEVKVADLTGAALDWAVAECEGYKFGEPQSIGKGQLLFPLHRPDWETLGAAVFDPRTKWGWIANVPVFSEFWQFGGPIIDRECILFHGLPGDLSAWIPCVTDEVNGPTHLIAAMRCYVASKRGDVVMVPAELVAQENRS